MQNYTKYSNIFLFKLVSDSAFNICIYYTSFCAHGSKANSHQSVMLDQSQIPTCFGRKYFANF